MTDLGAFEVWLVTGSQHLYGPETLETVAAHAAEVAGGLDAAADIPVRVVARPVAESKTMALLSMRPTSPCKTASAASGLATTR